MMTMAVPKTLAWQNNGSSILVKDEGSSVAVNANKPATLTSKSGNDNKTATNSTELEEMMLTIKRLEDRVKELESKLGTSKNTVAESVKEVNAAKEEVAKAQDMKDMKGMKAEDKKNDTLPFFQNTEITGFVDGYYGYNFNRPTGDAQLRNFDTKHNQFALNLVEIALEKKPTADSRLGFRTDLDFGPATEIVHSLEPGGADVFRHLQQGYLSYLAPAGKGLQIDFGKFVTQHGAEVIETKDNWNYSRSLMFALAIPYYHFGARVTYPFSDKFTLSGYLVNGWNNVVDNNTGKTLGIQAVIKPNSKLTIVQNYMTGPEQTNNNKDFRQLFDTTITVSPNDKVSLMGNYDYGWDTVTGARVHWQGIAAYARFQPNSWFAFTPRFEWYDDHDGFTTGALQAVKEITLTSEHKINSGLLTRFEYRRDFSDTDFFSKRSGRLVQAQSTVTFGLVYAFSSKDK
jgi:hypothetical protein